MNDGAGEEWLALLAEVVEDGERVAPRGQPTREILNATACIDMQWPVIISEARKLNYRFMAAEAYWIMSGDNTVEGIAPYLQAIAKFSDNGVSFFGAYGPKILEQLPYVIENLRNDNSSRQAVINIWRERPPKTKDVPCTLSLQFLIRKQRLHVVAHMRSSDLWLGFPYDVFNFSMIGHLVCEQLVDVVPGLLHWSAGSCHIYERNLNGVQSVLEEGTESVGTPGNLNGDVMSLLKLARDTLNLRPNRW